MEGGFLPEEVANDDGPRLPSGSSAAPGPGQPPRGCSRCTSLSFSTQWHDAFGVVLCTQCQRHEPLISKSTAKQRYCVTDGDLRGLGSLRKTNPHRRDWQPMQLLLESQVRRVAHEKHGGQEGVEEHARAILDAKMEALARRQREEAEGGAAEAEALARIKRRITEAGAEALPGAEVDEEDVEEI